MQSKQMKTTQMNFWKSEQMEESSFLFIFPYTGQGWIQHPKPLLLKNALPWALHKVKTQIPAGKSRHWLSTLVSRGWTQVLLNNSQLEAETLF